LLQSCYLSTLFTFLCWFFASRQVHGGSKSSKMRYGGRGGAGSRPRSISSTPTKCESITRAARATSVSAPKRPDAPQDAPPPVPAIPASSLAGRRGAAPLVLRAPSPQIVPPHSSATTPSTATDSEFPTTPRTPYFYFDDAFDTPPLQVPPPPPPSTPSAMSRSLRRLASRTQELFSKDRFLKAPPPAPTLPMGLGQPIPFPFPSPGPSPPSPSPSHDATTPLRSPAETSLTSEWYDPPDARARSASSATVKAHAHVQKQRRGRHRDRGERPRGHGEWNRDDVGEVIVALRMLK
ncbi:hypothetical protein B0H14DRAFT_2732193, partial [Mycena olivaceomarginata]